MRMRIKFKFEPKITEANMDETMMGDLASLKRPALQKLCKKFGIKANGKNVDMIRALEELRESASLVVHNIESMPHDQISQPEADVTLPNMPSPGVDKVSPPMRKSKRIRRGGRKKMDTKRKPPAHLSLSPTCSASSAGDTPLSLSGVPNKPCAWLTANTDSFNLSDSQLSCHQSAQSSPLHGRKRRHSGSANSSPEILAPVAKHARYELLPHQGLDDVSVSTEQPSKATAQVSNFSPRAPISPPQALTSPEAPTFPQPPVSPPQAPISSPEAPTSPQHPVPSPQAPISPPQALTSPPQVTFSPQAPISPPRAPTSPPLAPISPQSAPFSPPLASEDLQSNCKRRRKSTYTLEESVCDEQCEMKEQDEEPPSKRVRRATFSVSPKVTKRSGNEIAGTDENAFANVQGDSAETLNGIMDVHSEIMDLLDKRVEIIQADPNYKPVFSASESSSKSPLKTNTAVAKKFDSAHKKQFSRMQSIVSYQSDKERRRAAVRKDATPYTGSIPRVHPADKQKSKIPKAPCAASRPKSTSSFKPSALSVKQASFNFAANATKKAPKPETKPTVTSVKEPCENRMRKSIVASKTPGKNGGRGIVAKTPSNTFKFAATTSCTSTKKEKPHFDVTKSQKKNPTYKPYSGKLPDFTISRY